MPNVIIANKSKLACYALQNIISSFGTYNVSCTTSSGNDLLKKLKTAPVADILIMDVTFSDTDGYTLIKEIRIKHPKVKILIASDCTHQYIVNHMIKSGVAGFIELDADEKSIKKALDSVSTKGVHYNKLVTKELMEAIRNKEVPVIKLSSKQLQFMRMCSSDMAYTEMAEQLKLSIRTIDWHRDSLFAKFNFANRTQMALFALRNGIAQL